MKLAFLYRNEEIYFLQFLQDYVVISLILLPRSGIDKDIVKINYYELVEEFLKNVVNKYLECR